MATLFVSGFRPGNNQDLWINRRLTPNSVTNSAQHIPVGCIRWHRGFGDGLSASSWHGTTSHSRDTTSRRLCKPRPQQTSRTRQHKPHSTWHMPRKRCATVGRDSTSPNRRSNPCSRSTVRHTWRTPSCRLRVAGHSASCTWNTQPSKQRNPSHSDRRDRLCGLPISLLR